MSKKIKKTQLELNDKLEILAQVASKVASKEDICRNYGISTRTLFRIIKNKEKIEEDFQTNSGKKKRLRQSDLPKLDKVLLEWFTHQRSLNIPLSGPILREKATQFAKQLNLNLRKDEVTEAWISRFKKRVGISFRNISGQSASVDQGAVTDWLKNVWPLQKIGYGDEDIFNADERGLFYEMLPNKTLEFKGKRCSGGKMSKKRITVLVCSNATGNVKMKLMVIGKSAKPRCFKSIKHLNRLPATYNSNSKAWMTQEIFKSHLLNWDKGLKRAGRSILLLLNNCSAHPVDIPGLKNIKLVFLPPNVTSVIQPMDAGVIKNLKHHYRKALLQKQILANENKETYIIDLKEAIFLLHRAWNLVTSETISNCFKKARITNSTVDCEVVLEVTENDEEIMQLADKCGIELPEGITLDDYVTFDDNLDTFNIPTDQEIINNVLEIPIEVETEDEEEIQIIEAKEISSIDARRYLTRLRDYALQSFTGADSASRALTMVSELDDLVTSQSLTSVYQQKITQYFSVRS